MSDFIGDLTPIPSLEPVPQLSMEAIAIAGLGGVMNAQAQALLNRTEALRRKIRKTPKENGGVSNGTANDTTAVTTTRTATGGYYQLDSGTTVADPSPDVWSDPFTAADNTFLKISGLTYDVSGCFAAGWKYTTTQRYLTMSHARTGKVIGIWSDGENTGDSHRFFLPFDIRRDGHAFIMAPETTTGISDILVRRSGANVDAYGNRFTPISFNEAEDKLYRLYATTAAGAPGFDAIDIIGAGTSPSYEIPALRPNMRQGWTVQTRAGGALKLSLIPGATKHTETDETSGNTTRTITRSGQTLAGVTFNTMLDVPAGTGGEQNWSKTFSDLIAGALLPAAVNIYDKSGATRNFVRGEFLAIAQSSGAVGSRRLADFEFDGTTLTVTDRVTSTLPAQFTATVALVGNYLQFQASYAGGLGTGYTMSVSIRFLSSGR